MSLGQVPPPIQILDSPVFKKQVLIISFRSIGYGDQPVRVENALRTLSGVELPKGTTAKTYRKE